MTCVGGTVSVKCRRFPSVFAFIYTYIYIYTVYNSFCKEGPIEGRATRSFAPLSKTNLNLGSLFALSFDGLTSVFFASFPSK